MVTACGRFDFATIARTDGSSIDTSDSTLESTCTGSGVFSTPQPVTAANTTATQYGSSISPDGLTLLYDQSNSSADERIYISTRASRTDDFPTPIELNLGAAVGQNDSDASLSTDNLDLYFYSSRAGSCIYHAHRTTIDDAFGTADKLSATCGANATSGPAITADGLALAYNTSTDTYGEGTIYITTRATPTDDFTLGAPAQGVDNPAGYPWLSSDQKRIYYEHKTNAGFELRFAQRTDPTGAFDTPIAMTDLNIADNVVDIGMTADESIAVMSIQKTDNFDIYIATRPCL
ncbi:MAG: hypothetical protein QM831_07650 [Kofleriaceae bacterium]